MKLRGLLTGGALTLTLALTACGGGDGGNAGGGGAGGGETNLTVGTDTAAELKFVPATISAPANTEVKLTFNNQSTSQPHNLTFQQGITAATATNVATGQSETLTFRTPGPGSYPFVCTIHPTMVGTLTVQ